VVTALPDSRSIGRDRTSLAFWERLTPFVAILWQVVPIQKSVDLRIDSCLDERTKSQASETRLAMKSGSLVVALVTVLLFLTSAASARYSTMDEVWMLVSVCAAAIATLELFLLNHRRRLLLLDPWRRYFLCHPRGNRRDGSA